jgi:hypothetical protein
MNDPTGVFDEGEPNGGAAAATPGTTSDRDLWPIAGGDVAISQPSHFDLKKQATSEGRSS